MKSFLVLMTLFGIAFAACPFMNGNTPTDIDLNDEAGHCPHVLKASVEGHPDVTAKGCVCKSQCGASLYDSNARCDWCYTKDSCGHSGVSGSWDYCVYPPDKTYESQSWYTKQDYLWKNVEGNQQHGNYPNVLGILSESVRTSFWNNADEMPAGRQKYIHSTGAVCRFTFRNDDNSSGYTGVLQPGVIQHGLIRMGPAAAVTTSSGVIPGLGVKFMRSGVQSANYVALVTLGPLPDNSYDFFQSNFTNHIPPPTGALSILAKKFNQASQCATQVGLSDMAQYDIDGNKVADPVFPFRLEMKSPLSLPKDPVDLDTLLNRVVTAVPPNSLLFDISAYDTPEHYASGKPPRHLGAMYTEDSCVLSAYGDSTLFFRHQLIEDDWKIHPEWMKALDPQKDCGASKLTLDAPAGCEGADTVFSTDGMIL